jgi:hypothetical protein
MVNIKPGFLKVQQKTEAEGLQRFVTAWKRKNRFFNEQGRLIA